MARAFRPGLDPKRPTPSEIADRAEAASRFTTDATPLPKKPKLTARHADAVERAVDPRIAIADNPTIVAVWMKPLVVDGVLVREYDVQATLLTGKRGVDLTTGGEP